MIIGQIQNTDKRQPQREVIINQIDETQLFDTKKIMADWKQAVESAKNIYNPDFRNLIAVLNDIMIDGHITGIISSIKNKVKAKDFQLLNASGELDEEKTEVFKNEWFFDFLDYCIEGKFYPYSLIQLGEIKDDIFVSSDLVPRENVVPQKEVVKKNSNTSVVSKGKISDSGIIYYNDPPWNKWSIFVGWEKDFGLLNKCAPHALSKKVMALSMWRYAEMFGEPYRKAQTDIRDDKRRENAEKMMKAWGSSPWGVFDKEDKVELVGDNKSDAYRVFIEPMKMNNEEMSKILAGQVGMFDEKSFVGSVEAQERLFNDFVRMFLRHCSQIVNHKLIPLLNSHRLPYNGYSFKWQADESVTLIEKVDIIEKLSRSGYKIATEEVEEMTGIPVEEKTINIPNEPSNFKDISNYYRNYIDDGTTDD